jgi:hypothetical protein
MDLLLGLAAGGFGGIIVGNRYLTALGLLAISASAAIAYFVV